MTWTEGLRAQYPEVNPGFFKALEQTHAVARELAELRVEVSYLIGWYCLRGGSVPVEELRQALANTGRKAGVAR